MVQALLYTDDNAEDTVDIAVPNEIPLDDKIEEEHEDRKMKTRSGMDGKAGVLCLIMSIYDLLSISSNPAVFDQERM